MLLKYESSYGRAVKENLFYAWKAGAQSFLQKVVGEKSTHFKELQNGCGSAYPDNALIEQSVLKAAKEEIDEGLLKSIENLVSADIFTDSFDKAEHFLEQGYKDSAASLIGAVLEDGLRKIAKNNEIRLKSKENIKSLNEKLASANIYNRLVQRKIEVWNAVRNNADHGDFEEFKGNDVEDMLKGVNGFLAEYL